MSHVATIDVKCTNVEAIQRACQRTGAVFGDYGVAKFYDGSEVIGNIVQLQGWKYPIVILKNGEIVYDNYEGEWGDIRTLNQFQQVYAIEAAKCEAENMNYAYTEEVLPTGVLKLTIEI